jgi:hypothetical protein
MSFHTLFGKHTADLQQSHWERGHFVSWCTVCGRGMIKLPGLPWRILDAGLR